MAMQKKQQGFTAAFLKIFHETMHANGRNI